MAIRFNFPRKYHEKDIIVRCNLPFPGSIDIPYLFCHAAIDVNNHIRNVGRSYEFARDVALMLNDFNEQARKYRQEHPTTDIYFPLEPELELILRGWIVPKHSTSGRDIRAVDDLIDEAVSLFSVQGAKLLSLRETWPNDPTLPKLKDFCLEMSELIDGTEEPNSLFCDIIFSNDNWPEVYERYLKKERGEVLAA